MSETQNQPTHIQNWNSLDRHHQPKEIEALIAEQRPKQILEYYDEAIQHTVRVFERRYGWKATI